MVGDEHTFEPIFLPPEREFMIDGQVEIRAPGYCVVSAAVLVPEVEHHGGFGFEGALRARYVPLHSTSRPIPPVVSFDRVLGPDESWDAGADRFDFFGAIRTGSHSVDVLPGLVVAVAETDTHVGPPPDEISGFEDWCTEMGVSTSLRDPVSDCFSAWHGVRFVPVTFLVPRPRPLAGNPSGIPNLDCVSVVLDNEEQEIIPVLNLRPLDSGALRTYSGSESTLPRSLLVGGGALGSKLATHLVRTGAAEIDIVDPDIFLEHNLARHDLRRVHVGLPKAATLIDELSRMTRDFKGTAHIMTLEDGLRSGAIAPADYDLTIDTSAAPGMHFALSYFDDLPRVFSAFSIPGGALGIACIEGPQRNPRIDELEGALYSLAASREDVSKWLKERFLDYVGIGGCRDITAVIADDVLSIHAARFSHLLRSSALQEESGAIWIHGSEGSMARLAVGPSEIVESDGWSVRVGAWARETVFRMLDEHKPNEVAGYLHGFRDSYRRQLIVVHASVEPLLVQSPSEVEIDTSQYVNPSENTLEYLGTWHTHPKGGTGTSDTDERTVSKMVGLPVLRHPLLFLIAGPGELRAHLRS
jgi:proteasome lid subunit RPN8/RPN11